MNEQASKFEEIGPALIWDGIGPAYIADDDAPALIDPETGLILIDSNGEWTDALRGCAHWYMQRHKVTPPVEITFYPLMFGNPQQIQALRKLEQDLEAAALAEFGFTRTPGGQIAVMSDREREALENHMYEDEL